MYVYIYIYIYIHMIAIMLYCIMLLYHILVYYFHFLLLLYEIMLYFTRIGALRATLLTKGGRKGTNGVSTNGVTANLMFFLTEVLFGYQSVKICSFCVPFPQSVKKHYFCNDPISVDRICPQPRGGRHQPSGMYIYIYIYIYVYSYSYTYTL